MATATAQASQDNSFINYCRSPAMSRSSTQDIKPFYDDLCKSLFSKADICG
jgi:hypothetical protein